MIRRDAEHARDGRDFPDLLRQLLLATSWALIRRFAVALVVLPASSLAQVPAALAQLVSVGPEFQPDTYTTSYQRRPAVAVDGLGNFIVVWQSNGGTETDATGYSIQAATGAGQFQVNTYTTGVQS